MESKKRKERMFHKKAFSEATRARAFKYYTVVRSSSSFYEHLLQSHSADRDVLEVGCGRGNYLPILAQKSAAVTVMDISNVAAKRARVRARQEQLEGMAFCVMDAEALNFADNTFDLICGTGILHHLNLERTFPGMVRILRSEGAAIFVEPLGHNPIINLYRELTPHLRTEDEHPLLMKDLEVAGAYFGKIETHFFHLNSLIAVPFRELPGFTHLLRVLDAIDRLLFKIFPLTRRFAWQVVIVFSQPNKARFG